VQKMCRRRLEMYSL